MLCYVGAAGRKKVGAFWGGGGQQKGDVMSSDSASSTLHQPSVSHLPTHRHLEAGYQLLGWDLGFQIPNYIFPLDTHNLVHHVGLELELHRWEGWG